VKEDTVVKRHWILHSWECLDDSETQRYAVWRR